MRKMLGVVLTPEDWKKLQAIIKYRSVDYSGQVRSWIRDAYSRLPKEAQ
jgi:extradiol dioxygenase family protein